MREQGFGIDTIAVGAGIGISEHAKWEPKWTIEKYDGSMNLYATEEIQGNLLLNEGITALLALLTGGAETAFNNANSYIGIGDSTTVASATQTGLQAVANKAYKAMDATYPQVSGQAVTFRSTFGPDDGNYDWKEFAVANGNSDAAKNLNRKVEAHGRKVFPDTWVIQLQISIA